MSLTISEAGKLLWDPRDRSGTRPNDMYLWSSYAEGFLLSGVALLERTRHDLEHPPAIKEEILEQPFIHPACLVVPALYQIRHGLELLLKMLALCGAADAGQDGEIRRTHDLACLHSKAVPILRAAHADDYANELKALVDWFHDYDPKGDEFRYPATGGKAWSLSRILHGIDTDDPFAVLDLTKLGDLTKKVAILIFTTDVVNEALSVRAEMEREAE